MPFPSRDHELPRSPNNFLERTFPARQDVPAPSTCGRCPSYTYHTHQHRATSRDPLFGTPCVYHLPTLSCRTNGDGPSNEALSLPVPQPLPTKPRQSPLNFPRQPKLPIPLIRVLAALIWSDDATDSNATNEQIITVKILPLQTTSSLKLLILCYCPNSQPTTCTN